MNWGHGIAIFLVVFVSSMVLLAVKASSSSFDLEAEDYYIQEIEFQGRIDALTRGRELDEHLVIESAKNDLKLTVDSELLTEANSIKIHFFRPNDSSLDRHVEVDFLHGIAHVNTSAFVKGKYNLLMSYTKNGEPYALERSIMISQ